MKIESSIEINADLEKVYGLAKDVEKFPEFMPDVKSLKVLKREGNKLVSEWVGYIKQFGRTMKWVEEDYWDDELHVCRFKQIEGDFSKYEGVWQFSASPGGTKLELSIDFEYEVPLIGAIIKGVLLKLVKANAEGMLKALKERAEKG